MGARSIGSVYIDIEARTAKLEQQVAGVKNSLTGLSKTSIQATADMSINASALEGKFLKFGAALGGARSIVYLLAKDFRDVVDNIEDVHGISPETIASVQELRYNLFEASNVIKGALATGLGWLQEAMSAVGTGAATALNFVQGIDTDTSGLNTPLTPDQNASARNPNFDKQVAEARQRLADVTARATVADAQYGAMLNNLYDLYKREVDFSNDATADTLTQVQRKIKAEETLQQIQTKTADFTRQQTAAEVALSAAQEKTNLAFDSKRQRLADTKLKMEALQMAVDGLKDKLAGLYSVEEKDQINLDKQHLLALTKQLTTATQDYNAAVRAAGEMWREVGTSIADDLGEAILKGQDFDDMLRKIAQDIEAILIKRMITQPLADFIGAGLGTFFGAHAMGGPVTGGEPTLIGEHGAEMWVPPTGGTIIPNDKLTSGSGSGMNVYIDAKGADQAAISRLESNLRALNASIERRAINAVVDHSRRTG